MRLRINNKNGNIIMVAFPDLPEEKRSRLLLLLKATFPNLVKFTNSAAEGSEHKFTAAHFTYWNKYATYVCDFFFWRYLDFLLSMQGEDYPGDVEPSASLRNKGRNAKAKRRINTSTCMPRSSEEIKKYSEQYQLLQECFQDVFDWMREAVRCGL